MKYKIFTALALAGSVLAELFGGWDMALESRAGWKGLCRKGGGIG